MDILTHALWAGLFFGFSPYVILGSLLPDFFILINHIQKISSKKGLKEYSDIRNFVKGKKDMYIDSGFFHDLGDFSHSIGIIFILTCLSYIVGRYEFTLFVYGYVLHSIIDLLLHKQSEKRFYFWPFKSGRVKGMGLFQWNFTNLNLIVLGYIILGVSYVFKFSLIPVSDMVLKYAYAIWFIFPAYIANMVPVLISKINVLNKPVDFGRKLWGKRIFGNSKTWRGIFFAIFYGWLIGFLQNRAFSGFILSVGAMTGDLTASFIKRRIGLKSGDRLWLVDQLNLLVGALLLSFIFGLLNVDLEQIIFLSIFTFFLHYSSSLIGYKLKVKKTPW